MNDIRLTTPEGYFEKSMERTMASVEGIRRRRKAVVSGVAAFVIVVAAFFSGVSIRNTKAQKDYYAMESEQARLDVFLEVNM